MAAPTPTQAAGGDRDETYDPSTVDANRAREQGAGVGQKDLDAQRDPSGTRATEQLSFSSDSELDKAHDADAKRQH